MVCDWGMSDLGPIALGENQDQIFLGKEITRNQNYSEATAKAIDKAISTVISEQYDRADAMIKEHKDALVKIAEGLLKYETLEGKHVDEILEHGEIRSEVFSNARGKEVAAESKKAKTSGKKKASKDDKNIGPGTDPISQPA